MTYCIIGNSHTDQFFSGPHSYFERIYKQGASIKGLVKKESTLRLKDDIDSYISTNPDAILVFFLGQVDVEFGYFYKCIVENIQYDIHEYITNLVTLYISYLQTLSTSTKMCVLSINPTTILDPQHIFRVCFECHGGRSGYYAGEYPILYEDVKDTFLNISYETRFTYNKLFNEKLEIACKAANIPFISLWDILCEKETVNPIYMPCVPNNHHLQHDSGELATSLYTRLNDIFLGANV